MHKKELSHYSGTSLQVSQRHFSSDQEGQLGLPVHTADLLPDTPRSEELQYPRPLSSFHPGTPEALGINPESEGSRRLDLPSSSILGGDQGCVCESQLSLSGLPVLKDPRLAGSLLWA